MTPTTITKTQRWVLALSALTSFMVVLDLLVVATALPSIHRDLGASLEDLEWTVNAYTLSFAVLIMTGAALGDRLGRRRMFATGLVVFAAASAACALAPSVGALVAARTVQGAGAAMIMPLALALLNAAFPPERRGWATGVYGSVTALAVVLGPALGGAVTQGLAWPWIFWINVPIALLAAPLVVTRMPGTRGARQRIDLAGLLLGGLAATGLVWALVRGNSAGWDSPEVLGTLIAGAALAVGFLAWQLRARAPMIPPALFRSRAFSAGNVATFFIFGSLFADVFFYSQLLQTGLGHDPLAAGLRLMPWTATFITVAPLAGNLADRIGSRPLLVGGLLLHAAGMIWIALIAEPGMAYSSLLGPFLLGGAGVSMAIPAAQTAVLAGIAPGAVGKAAGANSMLRELGGVFGIAIAAAVFAGAGGYATPQAFVDGFGPAIGVSAALALAGAVAALVLPARNVAPALPALQPEEA